MGCTGNFPGVTDPPYPPKSSTTAPVSDAGTSGASGKMHSSSLSSSPVHRTSVAHAIDAAKVATLSVVKGKRLAKGKPSWRQATEATSWNAKRPLAELPVQMRPHWPLLKISTAPKCSSSQEEVAAAPETTGTRRRSPCAGGPPSLVQPTTTSVRSRKQWPVISYMTIGRDVSAVQVSTSTGCIRMRNRSKLSCTPSRARMYNHVQSRVHK